MKEIKVERYVKLGKNAETAKLVTFPCEETELMEKFGLNFLSELVHLSFADGEIEMDVLLFNDCIKEAKKVKKLLKKRIKSARRRVQFYNAEMNPECEMFTGTVTITLGVWEAIVAEYCMGLDVDMSNSMLLIEV